MCYKGVEIILLALSAGGLSFVYSPSPSIAAKSKLGATHFGIVVWIQSS